MNGRCNPLFIVFYELLVPLPAVGQKTVIVDINEDNIRKLFNLRAEFFNHVLGAPLTDAFCAVQFGEKGIAAVGAGEGAAPWKK